MFRLTVFLGGHFERNVLLFELLVSLLYVANIFYRLFEYSRLVELHWNG